MSSTSSMPPEAHRGSAGALPLLQSLARLPEPDADGTARSLAGLQALMDFSGAASAWLWLLRGEAWSLPVVLGDAGAATALPRANPAGSGDGQGRLLPPDSNGAAGVELPLMTGSRLIGQVVLRWSPAAPDPALWLVGEKGQVLSAATGLLAQLLARTQEETWRLRAVLEHSERLSQLGKMAAGIAHEVGNPLAGISSIVQTLLGRTQDETARERLLLVKEQVARITAIIRQLVEYSRPTTERRRPLDFNELVRDAARLMRYEPRARGVDLTLELDDRLPRISGVPHQVQQVFLNLLHNAIDATEGRPWRSVRVHSRRDGDFAEFSVEDNGRGIPAADLPRIFDPFFTTKEPGRGTGLGLWICRGIVEALPGELDATSQVDRGTRFRLRTRIIHAPEDSGR